MSNLRIGLDIDDTIVNFYGTYLSKFGVPKNDFVITKNVYKLKNNRDFWENLPKIREINCEVTLYCTKRISSKTFTRNSLINNNFPIKPIYQVYTQKGNKADKIKGKIDVFIDDSISNVIQMNKSGIPTLLIDAPHNQKFDYIGRIYSLDYTEIETVFNLLKNSNFMF